MVRHSHERTVSKVMDVGPCVDERDVSVDKGVKASVGVETDGDDAALGVICRLFESRTSYGRQKTTLIAEVDVRRLVAYTNPLCHFSDTELLRRLSLEQLECGGDELTRQLRPTGRRFFRSD
jgi:hypothetical protein